MDDLQKDKPHQYSLDVLDQLIHQAEKRHAEQVERLRDLVARGKCITEQMRILVEIEDDLDRLNG